LASLTRTAANLRGEAGDRDVCSIHQKHSPDNTDPRPAPPPRWPAALACDVAAGPAITICATGPESLADLAAEINTEHEAGQADVRRGLEHYRQAGMKLLEAKGQCGHGNWLKWVKKYLRFSARRAQHYMELAKCEVTADLPTEWQRISSNSPAHVAHNRGHQEWYSPPELIEAARRVLGTIDLDPASSAIAQENVQATTYYTKDDDGLSQPWKGRVWINPPYAPGLVDAFVAKLVGHYRDGDVTAALVLVNNATETGWFRQLADAASAICFPTGRVRFLAPEGARGRRYRGKPSSTAGQTRARLRRHLPPSAFASG
jgi:ParB family chromosome partitioning protein